jgi:hypothetical protein
MDLEKEIERETTLKESWKEASEDFRRVGIKVAEALPVLFSIGVTGLFVWYFSTIAPKETDVIGNKANERFIERSYQEGGEIKIERFYSHIDGERVDEDYSIKRE